MEASAVEWDTLLFLRQQGWAVHEWFPVERNIGRSVSVGRWVNTVRLRSELWVQVDGQVTAHAVRNEDPKFSGNGRPAAANRAAAGVADGFRRRTFTVAANLRNML